MIIIQNGQLLVKELHETEIGAKNMEYITKIRNNRMLRHDCDKVATITEQLQTPNITSNKRKYLLLQLQVLHMLM